MIVVKYFQNAKMYILTEIVDWNNFPSFHNSLNNDQVILPYLHIPLCLGVSSTALPLW